MRLLVACAVVVPNSLVALSVYFVGCGEREPDSPISKLMSLLVAFAWCSSTAMTFSPSTRNPGSTRKR